MTKEVAKILNGPEICLSTCQKLILDAEFKQLEVDDARRLARIRSAVVIQQPVSSYSLGPFHVPSRPTLGPSQHLPNDAVHGGSRPESV